MRFWNPGRLLVPAALAAALLGGLLTNPLPANALPANATSTNATSTSATPTNTVVSAESVTLVAAAETPKQKANRLAKKCLKKKVSRAEIACIAKSQVGMREWGNNCNAYGWCDAWCGMFAQWVMTKAGGKAPKGYALAANWRKWKKVKTPKVGDVAVKSDGQHVEIVVKVSKNSKGRTVVASVGGNSSNKVSFHKDNNYAKWTYHRNPSVK